MPRKILLHFWFHGCVLQMLSHIFLCLSEANNDCLFDTFSFTKLPKPFCFVLFCFYSFLSYFGYLYKLNLYIFLLFHEQWVVKGAVDVDIGANPSAEGGEDEGVDDSAVKVVDIVDTFRLQVSQTLYLLYIFLYIIYINVIY